MPVTSQTFSRYDMVCDTPTGGSIEIVHMPEFFSTKPKIETTYAHVHNFYEIVWFKRARGVHYIDFDKYPLKDNTILFISPGQVHAFREEQCQEGYVIKICSELLSESVDDSLIYLKYNVFRTDVTPIIHISEANATRLQTIVDAISEERERQSDIGHKDYLQALVKMLIIHMERSCEQDNTLLSTTKTSHRTFLAFRQQLECNYTRLHTVKEYAALLNVSTKTLTSYVAECSTMSPLEIINRRITLEAKRQLRYSHMMVKEIAHHLGFEDPSYFVKFFKRMTGHLPADYRELDSSCGIEACVASHSSHSRRAASQSAEGSVG